MIRLAIRCRPELSEAVLAELATVAPEGVEERDLGDTVEYAIYGADGELPDVGDLDAAVGGAIVDVSSSAIADDWESRWRQFHKPITIGDRLHVRPPWAPAPKDELIDIVVDPGEAFGTGAHATTRLCLELLLEIMPHSGPITDLGSGSGVLAIAAAKLGFGPIKAYDNDPASVRATAENAERNAVQVEVERLDVRESLPALAEVTVANLLSPLLIELAGGLRPEDAPSRLICSGILADQADAVAAAFAEIGYDEHEPVPGPALRPVREASSPERSGAANSERRASGRRSQGEWVALKLLHGSRL